MATSDGISSADWDLVHGCAVDVVNAPDADKPQHTQRLLDCLEVLEAKYGPLPSILATRADCLDEGDPAREQLLLRAFALSETRDDASNVVHVASSLAELFLDKRDLPSADRWLKRMRESMAASSDPDHAEYERLRAEYRRLAIQPGLST